MYTRLFQSILICTLLLPQPVWSQTTSREHTDRVDSQRHHKPNPKPKRDHKSVGRTKHHDLGGQDKQRKRPTKQRGRVTVDRLNEAFETIRLLHPNGLPKRLQKLEQTIKANPKQATRAINRFPRIYELMQIRRFRPEEFQLHADQFTSTRQALKLAHQLRKTKQTNGHDQERAEDLRKRLRAHVRDSISARLQIKRLEIDRYRARLKKAEKGLAELEGNIEQLVAQKLRELETQTGKERPDRRPNHSPKENDQPQPMPRQSTKTTERRTHPSR